MPTQIQISSNARLILAQARRTRSLVLDGLRKGLNEENGKTIVALTLGRMGYSKAGPVMPDGLRRISSTAVRSLRATPAVVSGNGVASSLGSNLRYLIAHEFGYSGTVVVPSHDRRIFKHGKARLVRFVNPVTKEEGTTRKRSRRLQKDSQGNDRTTLVKTHTMKMNLPARHMIRDTLAARIPEYAATLSAAIVAAHTALRDAAASAPIEPMSRTP